MNTEESNKLSFSNFAIKLNNQLTFIDPHKIGENVYYEIFNKGYELLNITLKNSDIKLLITPVGSSLVGNPNGKFMIEDIPFGLIGKLQKDEKKRYIYGILTYIAISNWLNISVTGRIWDGIIKQANTSSGNYNYGKIEYSRDQQKLTNYISSFNSEPENEIECASIVHVENKLPDLFNHIFTEISNYLKEKVSLNDSTVKLPNDIYYYVEQLINEFLIENSDVNDLKVSLKEPQNILNAISLNYSLFYSKSYLPVTYYFFSLPFIKDRTQEYNNYGNLVICSNKNINDTELLKILQFFSLNLMSTFRLFHQLDIEEKLRQAQLKTAIISILVDSYAHNISAHSLSALKWWFELRSRILEKRIKVDKNDIKIKSLKPCQVYLERKITSSDETKDENIFAKEDPLMTTSYKYYEALGLTDSTFNAQYFSLFDYLQFVDDKTADEILKFKDEASGREFDPRFPVSLDYALYPFFRFLRDKGAFWSGVTRDMVFGGESKTWYQILWEDFANNPLYLGTIAKSEGISKLNINLAIKNGKSWETGNFVTIDLSLMEYEERIANNPSLKIEYQKNDYDLIEEHLENLGIQRENVKGFERDNIKKEDLTILDKKLKEVLFSIREDDKPSSEEVSNTYVEAKKYSKYAFIKLGKQFSLFREILNTNDFTAFLPGGVVGEHSLFTIFENTIRNIKHYNADDQIKLIRKNGIDFWIAIEPDVLSISNIARNSGKQSELFKVNVWLGHKTECLTSRVVTKEYLWEKVSVATKQPILDENGVPRMGGNSQDKACAAMLFNNKFNSVEESTGMRNEDYFPWLHFSTNYNEKEHYKSENDVPSSKIVCRINKKNYDQEINTYIESRKAEDVYLKKHFYLWKSDDYLILNSKDDLKGENVSRFKFVIISPSKESDEEKATIINYARQDGVIRLLYDNSNGNISNLVEKLRIIDSCEISYKDKRNEKLQLLYSHWLKIWLHDFNVNFKIALKNGTRNSNLTFLENNNWSLSRGASSVSNLVIKFSHGGKDEPDSCNVRSHGAFWSKYFTLATNKQPSDLLRSDISLENVVKENFQMFDFAETVATNVFMFDNRLKNRMPTDQRKLKVFERDLKLVIREEKLVENKESFKANLDSLIENFGTPNILVVHLSFIESLGYKESNCGFMNSFIEKELSCLINNENFIFIITTGRGRNAWKDNLKPEYLKKTIFKPVESFIQALENGISYNDDFDVKHNIIRVIFGS